MARDLLHPPKARPGDKIAVLSPSFAAPGVAPAVHEQAMVRLAEATGLVPVEYPTTRRVGASAADRARDLDAAFGDPEILYTTALMVPEGNPKNLKTLDDVKKSGAKLTTMSGAIESDYAKALDIKATQVKSPQDGMEAVTRGRSDVFALTGISLRTMDEKNPDAKVEVTEPFVAVVDGKEQVGAGATVFKKGDDTLREAYNKELAKITGDEKAYTDVIGEFGFTDAERPKGDLTTEQLCKGELPDAK